MSVKRKSNKSDPLLEIRSKTHKMIREGRIALPYHQPKQHTLDEFLHRRNNMPSIPLNLSSDSLYLVSERLSKREKEVAEFYESDSEQENPTLEDEIEKTDSDASDNGTIVATTATSSTNHDLEIEINNDTAVSENEIVSTESSLELVVDLVTENTVDKIRKCAIGNINNYFKNVESCQNRSMNTNSTYDATSLNIENTDTCDERIINSVSCQNNLNFLQDTCVENPSIVQQKENKVNVDAPDNHSTDMHLNSDTYSHLEDNYVVKNINSPKNVETVIHKKIEAESQINEEGNENPFPSKTNVATQYNTTAKTSAIGSTIKFDDVCPSDSQDFQLDIQTSCTDDKDFQCSENRIIPTEFASENHVNKSKDNLINEDVIRSRKLALLSKYNIDISSDPKPNIEPSLPIKFEIEVPSIFELKRKLAKHVISNKAKEKPTKLSVISTRTDSQGEVIDVVKEVLMLRKTVDLEDESVQNKFSLPGSKHTHFKDTILKALVTKKEANWSKIQQEKRDTYVSGDFDDEDDDVDFSGRKLNFEPYHPEEEPDDDDLIEDDIKLKDKKKRKNDFLDEEADVSYDEEENIDNESEEDVTFDGEYCDEENEDSDTNEERDDEEEKDDECESEVEKTVRNWESGRDAADVSSCANNEDFKEPLMAKYTEKLFKNDISGAALENKLLGLESINTQCTKQSQEITNSQILSLCSGKFVTQPLQSESMPSSQDLIESQICDNSQNFDLSMLDTNDGFPVTQTKSTSLTNNNRNLLLLSDDSDTEDLFIRKKKAIRIEDSDDDESEKCNQLSDPDDPLSTEKNLNYQEEDEEEDTLDEKVDEGVIAYDSEEEIVNFKETVTKEFFENEAELSESEWESEDENEKDLDELEQEAGDAEEIDTDKLKEELGKIHMRQLLDDDQREVRLLQEMLLEDGEMHSNKNRQRRFQWKNLNGDDFFLKGFNDSDEENILNGDDDIEVEENWRKIRHERETFLSLQEKRNERLLLDLEDKESDFLQITTTAKVITGNDDREEILNPSISPTFKLPFNAKHKCGSFLSRGKMLLNRIAVTVGESKDSIQGRAKNSRNFVFAAKSPEKETIKLPGEKTEKRKISSKTVMTKKKVKLSTDVDSSLTLKKPGLLAQLALSE